MPVLSGQGPLSKGVSGAIGLATEAYAHHQESKDKQNQAKTASDHHVESKLAVPTTTNGIDHTSGASSNDSSDNEDEEDWIRDDLSTSLDPPPPSSENPSQKPHRRPPSSPPSRKSTPQPPLHPTPRLPYAVIIPQRRPSTNRRGFVAAYAPALSTCGISESTFMDFHATFQRATHKQGLFNVLNLAIALSVLAETAAVAPSVIVHSVAFCVHASIEAGRRLYITHKTNTVLDEMNDALFKPHGLYAMIMAYKPSDRSLSSQIDVNAAATTATTHAVSARLDGTRSTYKPSSGTTHSPALLPPAAPLVFPLLRDDAPTSDSKFKRAAEFEADYTDRRAQAVFEAENPAAGALTGGQAPRKPFASRWADPTDPVNGGGFVNVLSGGLVNPREKLVGKKGGLGVGGGGGGKLLGGGGGGKLLGGGGGGGGGAGVGGKLLGGKLGGGDGKKESLGGKAKRALKENVLYLMVVNMPTEEEMRVAAEVMERAEGGGLGGKLQGLMGDGGHGV